MENNQCGSTFKIPQITVAIPKIKVEDVSKIRVIPNNVYFDRFQELSETIKADATTPNPCNPSENIACTGFIKKLLCFAETKYSVIIYEENRAAIGGEADSILIDFIVDFIPLTDPIPPFDKSAFKPILKLDGYIIDETISPDNYIFIIDGTISIQKS